MLLVSIKRENSRTSLMFKQLVVFFYDHTKMLTDFTKIHMQISYCHMKHVQVKLKRIKTLVWQ